MHEGVGSPLVLPRSSLPVLHEQTNATRMQPPPNAR
jgi:hypothetical protein